MIGKRAEILGNFKIDLLTRTIFLAIDNKIMLLKRW